MPRLAPPPRVRGLRLATVAAVTFLFASVSIEQGPPGGGGGQDTNPANPLNWAILPAVYEGQDQRVDWISIFGVATQVTGTDVWENPNDSLGDLDPPAHNETSYSKTVSWTSEGTITLKMQWIGVGPGPSSVLVKITSTATGQYWGSGSATANNGIGTPAINLGPLQTGKISSGSVKRYVGVVNGIAEAELEVAASATATGFGEAGALANSKQASIALADRSVTLSSSVDLTARKGPTGIAEANSVTDIEHVYGDTACNVYSNIYGDQWGAIAFTYSRGLWGQWTSPFNEFWYHTLDSGNNIINAYACDSLFSEIEWVEESLYFQPSTLQSMVSTGPLEYTAKAKVTNSGGSGDSREANYTMRVHSPVEYPTILQEINANGQWYPCSQVVTILPNGGPVTRSYSVTTTETVTAQLNLSAPSDKLVGIGLGFSFGESATISMNSTTQFTFTPDPENRGLTVHWEVVRRTLWKEIVGEFDAYDTHGFNGETGFVGKKFRSGSKAVAEAQDYEEMARYWYDS